MNDTNTDVATKDLDGKSSVISSIQDDLNSFLEERFSNNIQSFKKYLPEIANFFEHYNPQKNLKFFCSDNFIPNLFIKEINDFFYKTDDPVAYCKNIVQLILSKKDFNKSNYSIEEDVYGQIYDKYLNCALDKLAQFKSEKIHFNELDVLPFVIVNGVGLGYILGELYEKVNIENLVIVEHDPDIFYASLHTFDWNNLLSYIFSEHLSIDIVICDDPTECFSSISKLIKTKGYYLSCSLLMVNHYIDNFINSFNKIIESNFSSLASLIGFYDDYLFGVSHASYALSNKKHFVITKEISYEMALCPVFIVGSGPSLDKDIPFLYKYRNKAIIIACGTAVGPLISNGIVPDFWSNTERVPETMEVLSSTVDKSFFSDVILLCSDVCHPLVEDNFKRVMIFGKKNEPFYPYIKSINKKFESVQYIDFMNPMVGNMGIASAAFLGFRNLFLFGLDNGVKKEFSSIHSIYAEKYEKIGTPIYVSDLRMECPANFGGTCTTNNSYLISKNNITNLIKIFANSERELVVFNCSDGAYIELTTPKHSNLLVDEFEQLPELNKKEICDYLYSEKSLPYYLSREEIEKILDAEGFTKLCEIIISKLKDFYSFSSRKEYLEKMRDLSVYLNSFCSEKELFHKKMITSSLQSLFIVLFNSIYARKSFSECLSLSKDILSLLIDFTRECCDLYQYLPDYVMGDHLKYFKNNKVGKDMQSINAPNIPIMNELVKKYYGQ